VEAREPAIRPDEQHQVRGDALRVIARRGQHRVCVVARDGLAKSEVVCQYRHGRCQLTGADAHELLHDRAAGPAAAPRRALARRGRCGPALRRTSQFCVTIIRPMMSTRSRLRKTVHDIWSNPFAPIVGAMAHRRRVRRCQSEISRTRTCSDMPHRQVPLAAIARGAPKRALRHALRPRHALAVRACCSPPY